MQEVDDREPTEEMVDAVEEILLKILIDGGHLKAEDVGKREAFVAAYESWETSIRIERVDMLIERGFLPEEYRDDSRALFVAEKLWADDLVERGYLNPEKRDDPAAIIAVDHAWRGKTKTTMN